MQKPIQRKITSRYSSTNASTAATATSQPDEDEDVEIVTNCIKLINTTIAGLARDKDNQDYDYHNEFLTRLIHSGMDQSTASKYSQLDPKIREQFELYEKATNSVKENESNRIITRVDNRELKSISKSVDILAMNCDGDTRNNISSNMNTESARLKSIRDKLNEKDDHFSACRRDNVVADQSPSSYRRVASNVPLNRSSTLSEPNIERDNCYENAPLAKSEFNESGETTNEENYESANDDQRSSDEMAANTSSLRKSLDIIKTKNSDGKTKTSSSHSNARHASRDSNGDNEKSISSSSTNRLVQTVDANNQQQATKIQHQLQLRSHKAALTKTFTSAPSKSRSNSTTANVSTSTSKTNANSSKQNNLTRGKHQRASISSCSSSDSYASYGSGYASGSGNSTDHEQKHYLKASQKSAASDVPLKQDEFGESVSKSDQAVAPTKGSPRLRKHPGAARYEVANDVGKELRISGEEDETESFLESGEIEDIKDEHDGDSQLKQHLSELEQLTDELANRDVFSTFDRTHQVSAHYSSTIKSNSSNSSSILSTGSNTSSLISNNYATLDTQEKPENQNIQSRQQEQLGQVRKQSSNPGVTPATGTMPSQVSINNESRSTSTTPTSIVKDGDIRAHNYAQQLRTHPPTSSGAAHSQQRNTRSMNQYTKSSIDSELHSSQGSASSPASATKQTHQQDTYYHNLFQWEQLVSKGVTRPLLINDLDFTDLRDEDDCDLLNSNASNSSSKAGRSHFNGEPLTISIPPPSQDSNRSGNAGDHDSVDSGASSGSCGSRSNGETSVQQLGTPASAPPPMPPPPISPWFNTISGSRPQSQFMSTPSPPPPENNIGGLGQSAFSEFNRDQSPANSTYSSYSRNSVCIAPGAPIGAHFNTLQPKGNLRGASSMSSLLFGNNGKYGSKRKKTMKLFWKEFREDKSLLAKLTKKKTIWDEIKPVPIDTQKLEYLFESKAKDISLSKSRNGLDGLNQKKVKITVLDAKRSNAINIGMTKLPPMRTIKNAILKMDSSIMNREGIEKILTTMMPSEEEKTRIIEAQLANPDTPLGTAEQFLLNLASISALEARLKLWAFQLDYAQIEKEVAEPLMDLKQAIGEIERSETFRVILGTLLSIGNFLNSTNVKGFQIDYLEKVPEVKDTIHKHSLLHHLCLFIQEKFPELDSDLYSEFSAVNRASKVDYAEVSKNLKKMQQDCKASWDHLKIVAKHDGLANLMNTCGISSPSCDSNPSQHQPKSSGKLNNLSKLSMITTVIGSDNCQLSDRDQQNSGTKQLKIKVSDFLTDCAERIMVLMVIHRRVMNRFQKLLVYLGCPSHQIKQTQPQQILKIINEFALEFRTNRSRVREMLMRVQKCQHHGPLRVKRWQMGRWAGSQQAIDSMGYNRTSSAASGYAGSYGPESVSMTCADCSCCSRNRMDRDSMSSYNHIHQNQNSSAGRASGASNRCSSPSGVSQMSNYSDYIYDHSCCGSRRESITPVPSDKFINSVGANQRAHSMSVSMFDLQQQQHGQIREPAESITDLHQIDENELTAQQKDEQLRRLLGVDKSFYGACRDLHQMKHWTSTMAGRVTRPESQGKIATIRRMSGQQLERRESDEHGKHTLPA